MLLRSSAASFDGVGVGVGKQDEASRGNVKGCCCCCRMRFGKMREMEDAMQFQFQSQFQSQFPDQSWLVALGVRIGAVAGGIGHLSGGPRPKRTGGVVGEKCPEMQNTVGFVQYWELSACAHDGTWNVFLGGSRSGFDEGKIR